MLIQGQNVLSTGGDFTSNGPIISAISYVWPLPILPLLDLTQYFSYSYLQTGNRSLSFAEPYGFLTQFKANAALTARSAPWSSSQ